MRNLYNQEQTHGMSRELKGHPNAADITPSLALLLFGSDGSPHSSHSREPGGGFAEVEQIPFYCVKQQIASTILTMYLPKGRG